MLLFDIYDGHIISVVFVVVVDVLVVAALLLVTAAILEYPFPASKVEGRDTGTKPQRPAYGCYDAHRIQLIIVAIVEFVIPRIIFTTIVHDDGVTGRIVPNDDAADTAFFTIIVKR